MLIIRFQANVSEEMRNYHKLRKYSQEFGFYDDLTPSLLIYIYCLLLAHGNWGSWVIGACTTSCGNGTQIRERHCNFPPPANGGNLCSNENGINQTMYQNETVGCSNPVCPSK